MADLARDLEEARDHAAPAWTPDRAARVRAAIDERLGARRRQRTVAFRLAVACLVLGGLFAWQRHGTGSAARPVTAALMTPALLRLPDGSVATAVGAGARVEPVEVGQSAATVRLASGAARFSVTPNPARTFRVLAKDVTVTVLGTVFTVDGSGAGVRVSVERGRVRVEWPGGDRVLGVGETAQVGGPDGEDPRGHRAAAPRPDDENVAAGTVAPAADDENAATAAPAEAFDPEPGAATEPRVPPRAAASGPSWRTLAQDGEYAAALSRMTSGGADSVRDEPGDLLLAADVARLGGKPERALKWLSRVATVHASDSRAPLAAFTLGRTLLDQLGRPREAAQAFAAARRLAPRGALAQDALAREVESWARAGEASLAHQQALVYVERYPNGRRLAAVRRLGELD